MNQSIGCFFLILLSLSVPSFARPTDPNDNYWQCSTYDAEKNKWTAKHPYQKMALNTAYSACKKKSKMPTTCKTSNSDCKQFIHGENIMPMWKCTAFDREALPWSSKLYPNREDAALAAQAYCKQKSPMPSTCFINLVTCINKNEI